MPRIIYLGKLKVACPCGAHVVPDPSLAVGTLLHECADFRILQGLPPDDESPEPGPLNGSPCDCGPGQ